MKKLSCLLAIGTLVIFANRTQAQRDFVLDGQWMREKMEAPAQTMPVDEAMEALAKAAPLNAFVDATNLPIDTLVQPYGQRPKDGFETNYNGRANVIGYAATQARLTYDRTARDTFVFWPKPDINHLINLIVTRHGQLDAAYPIADEDALVAALKEYFARTQGWVANPDTVAEAKAHIAGVENAVSVNDLPTELQAPVKAAYVRQLRLSNFASKYQRFELANWKAARVLLVRERLTYFKADGDVGGTPGKHDAISSAIEVFFPPPAERLSSEPLRFYVGTPMWANPGRIQYVDFAFPRYLTEAPPLSQFEAEPIGTSKTALATADKPAAPLDFGAIDEFQKPVRLQARRVPLRELVAGMAAQTGVGLQVAPDVAPDAQVTVFSSEMKLGEAVRALERLYGARLRKAERGYELTSLHHNELEQLMARVGTMALYESEVYTSPQRDTIGAQLAEEVSSALDSEQLLSPQGAAFAELSPQLQAQVMQLFRDSKGGELIVMERRVEQGLEHVNDFKIRFSQMSPQSPQFFGAFGTRPTEGKTDPWIGAGFRAFSPDDRFITLLFPQVFVSEPTLATNIENRDRNRQRAEELGLRADG